MELINSIFVLMGGLGLFFYGMGQFSEALQSASSDLVKKVLSKLTSNRVFSVMAGAGITVMVQSSSISTAMTVGLVNAGLLSLVQAVGIIFGANIGTTVTGWIIAIKVSHLGLHMVGIGLFLSALKKYKKISVIGKITFGLGLVFFGLETMSNVFKPLRTNEDFIANLYLFNADTMPSLLMTVAMGCLLTVVVQSSSAMLGITIALASTGTITFQTAVALVMGENIGTTITAILAAVGGNTNAKRVALGHVMFNASGTLVLIFFFHHWVAFIDWMIPVNPDLMLADGSKPHIAQHIATSHSMFNIFCTLLFTPFLTPFVAMLCKIFPEPAFKEQTRLVHPEGVQIAPVLAIEEAYQELNRMADITRRIMSYTKDCIGKQERDPELKEKIHKYEDILDRIQAEILIFLNRVMEEHLTHEQTVRINTIIQVAADLENIGDYCRNLMKLRARLFDEPEHIQEQDFKVLEEFMVEACQNYAMIFEEIRDPESASAHHFDNSFNAFKQKTKRFRVDYLRKADDGKYSPLYDLSFADMIASMRKINGHCGAINRTLAHMLKNG